MAEEKKLYTVQGSVEKVYPAQSVQSASGGRKWTSQKTDVILKQFNGSTVRITFWDQAVEEALQGESVSITNLKYTGVYKEVHQFGSTKESKIHVQTGGAVPAEPAVVKPVNAAKVVEPPTGMTEPTVSEPVQEVDPVLETASQIPDDLPSPGAKKRGRPAKVETPVVQTTASAQPVSEQTCATTAQVSAHPSEALVLSNLQAAERISKAMGYERLSMEELIQLSDQVGRTAVALKIEAGKDNRMAKYKS